jgi:alpha/beta hydrolase fold
MANPVHHRRLNLDGIDIFYRAAGPANASVVLLPHGYPCSSYEFREYMPRLADRWRLVARDFPGIGYSGTPEDFAYSFDGDADFPGRFAERLQRFAIYLHDFGSQIGLRLASKRPDRIAALIIQRRCLRDALGPKCESLKAYWANPTPQGRAKLVDAVTEEGFRGDRGNPRPPVLGEGAGTPRIAWTHRTNGASEVNFQLMSRPGSPQTSPQR